jgi:hypothetical protein
MMLGCLGFLLLWGTIPALSQPAGPEMRYLVVWKSRYNDKDYRSEWFYGDPALAQSVADELRQFHAFKGVRVITVPVVLSPDGISGKLVRDDFAGRGTGAFTVTDLWNYSVPGDSGGGKDSQAISLRRADPPSASDSGATTTRPTAPASGGRPARERLVYDENASKGQKPGVQTTSPKKSLGANERPVKEEILSAKSEVLQSEQQRLDKDRALLKQAAPQDGEDYRRRLNKYLDDLKEYKGLVGQLQSDLDSHHARFNPQPARSQSTSSDNRPSTAPPRTGATKGGPYRVVVRSSVYARQLIFSGSFDTRQEAVNEARRYDKQMVNITIRVTDRNGNRIAW